MITIAAITDNNGNVMPESKPLSFGSLFTGTEYLFFESISEKDAYLSNLLTLDASKKQLIDLIDERSVNKINEGFLFDGNRFSLSLSAQINWSNLLFLPQNFFPVNLSTKDDDIYVLTYANVQSFYNAALLGKNTPLQEGNILKQQVKDCTTKEELDIIKNNL